MSEYVGKWAEQDRARDLETEKNWAEFIAGDYLPDYEIQEWELKKNRRLLERFLEQLEDTHKTTNEAIELVRGFRKNPDAGDYFETLVSVMRESLYLLIPIVTQVEVLMRVFENLGEHNRSLVLRRTSLETVAEAALGQVPGFVYYCKQVLLAGEDDRRLYEDKYLENPSYRDLRKVLTGECPPWVDVLLGAVR